MSLLPVHRRSTLQASGTETDQQRVECPTSHRSVSIDACRHCHDGGGLVVDEETAITMMDCARALAEERASSFETRIHVLPVIALAARDVLCVVAGAPIDRIRSMMIEAVVGCLPVVDSRGRPIGTVSAIDLLCRPRATTAFDAMSTPVVSVHEMTSITRAAAVMAYEGIHHLPVVDDCGVLVAMLSSVDIMRHVGQEQGFLIPNESRRRRHLGTARAE